MLHFPKLLVFHQIYINIHSVLSISRFCVGDKNLKYLYTLRVCQCIVVFVLFCFWFFAFLWLYLQHIEVSRLGTGMATLDLSHICDLCHSSQQCQILNPLSEARNQTHIPMDPSLVCYHWATTGTAGMEYLEAPEASWDDMGWIWRKGMWKWKKAVSLWGSTEQVGFFLFVHPGGQLYPW